MAADNFWSNREQAQKIIDEANTLRGKIEPLLQAEKQVEDARVMIELGEAEPPAAQAKMEAELNRDATRLIKELDALELKVFLNGPHDRNNCILSINSGAGGTEACDWAEHAHAHVSALGGVARLGSGDRRTRCPAKARASRASRC